MHKGRLIILSDYVGGDAAATGGAGHAVLASYHALRAADVAVRVIAGFGPIPSGALPHNVSLGGHDLREGGGIAKLRAIYNSAAQSALGEELADEDPERTVIILHQWTRYLSPAALGALAGFRLMIYMHDYFWACPNGAYYDFQAAAPCMRQPMGPRCLSANCDRLGRTQKLGRIARHAALLSMKPGRSGDRLCLHLSERAKDAMEPLLPDERHAIVHNISDLTHEPPTAAENVIFDVGYFGRLEAEKGVSMLLAAIDLLGLSALVVGEGALEAEVAGRPAVEHRTWQPRATVQAAMRRCRIIVLPSLWRETWGLIVPEAMAAGVLVLVSAHAGSAELVERFGGGAVFDPDVPGDLAAKLHDLLLDEASAVHDWDGLRESLTARRHADSIISLAAEHWDIDLRVSPRASVSLRPAASELAST